MYTTEFLSGIAHKVEVKQVGIAQAREKFSECVAEALGGMIVSIANAKRPDLGDVVLISAEHLQALTSRKPKGRYLADVLNAYPRVPTTVVRLQADLPDAKSSPLRIDHYELGVERTVSPLMAETVTISGQAEAGIAR